MLPGFVPRLRHDLLWLCHHLLPADVWNMLSRVRL